MRRFLLSLVMACACFSFGKMMAEEQSLSFGNISGHVVDADTGQPIKGAAMAILEEPAFYELTDLKGRYSFKGVPSGSYTIRVFKGGYIPFDVNDVAVAEDSPAIIDIPLPKRKEQPAPEDKPVTTEAPTQSEVFELAAFQVTAEVIQNAEVTLLKNRQKSLAIGDAIGSTAFSRMDLSDAAEAMTKVTGASVVDNKYVYVRGMGDRYTSTLLNGATIPSADPDRRAVQMDQFPSDLLESIVTSKSFTPDQPGSFSGGSVNVKTKSFPEYYFFTIQASAKYNSNTTGKDILVTREGVNWKADGIDDRPRTKASQDEIPQATGRAVNTATGAARIGDLSVAQRLDSITREFTKHFYPVLDEAHPGHGLNLAVGDTFNFKNGGRFGYTLSFTWDRDSSYYDKGIEARWATPSDFKDSAQVYTTDPKVLSRLTWYNEYWNVSGDPYDGKVPFGVSKSSQTVNWGSFGKFAWLPGDNHELSLTLFHNQSAEDEIKHGVGDGFNSSLSGDTLFEAISVLYTERGVSSAQLNGKHLLTSIGDLEVDWQASLSESTQDQPDYRTLFTAWDYEEQEYKNVNASDLDPPIRRYRDMLENTDEYSLNFSLPVFQASTIKWGGLYSDSARDYSEITYLIQPSTWQGQSDPALVREIYTDPYIGYDFSKVEEIDLDGDGVVDRYNIIPAAAGRHFIERGSEGNNYTADGTVEAMYLMGDFNLMDKWRLITGARYESNEMHVLQLLENLGVENREGGFSANDLLPALSLVYTINPEQNIRFAYGRTIAKPSFKELSPVVIDDSFTGDRFQGNPDLNRSVIDNLDLRWEWFIQGLDLVAVSAFYKEMDEPIEVLFFGGIDTNGDGSINNLDSQPFQRGNIVPQNVPSGSVYGLELEYRLALSRLNKHLDNFSIGGNLSLIESDVDVPEDEQLFFGTAPSRQLVGQSPFLFNFDLSYDNDDSGTYLNLSYNFTDKRLSVVNPNNSGLGNVYEAGVGRLGFTFTQRLNGNAKLKIAVNNILDPVFEKYYTVADGPDLTYERYQRGITCSISYTYTFE